MSGLAGDDKYTGICYSSSWKFSSKGTRSVTVWAIGGINISFMVFVVKPYGVLRYPMVVSQKEVSLEELRPRQKDPCKEEIKNVWCRELQRHKIHVFWSIKSLCCLENLMRKKIISFENGTAFWWNLDPLESAKAGTKTT